ncbi:NrfD/PsrC family molybdoenzyme membrane anchor subunit [Streptomyces sp. Inha503]|uniref:NrfD/PsrC family molybdoenzyme membrane anchor subunit n=1 Tax=Streptomyces sp. Inha503 TaxID=3383314 RepID=UPI0039A1B590
MSESDVTRDGIRGARPGRDAQVGKGMGDGERPGRKGGKGRGGERSIVPRAEFTSYYGRPVLNPPTWRPRDIAGYFFLGGLAGAGSVLAAGAELTGRPAMARALKVSSLAALTGSTAALIHDLGRPGRFANMLRVFKPTSPMSVGSWVLAAYGPMAGAAAASDLAGRLPRTGRAATVGAALLGPAVASYTAVLAADTAVPAWHDGYRELPYLFVGSAAMAAGGMALLASPVAENAPARGVALLGTAVETAAVKAMERRLGVVAETYREGRAGKLMRAAEALSVAGALGGALLGRRGRPAAALGGAALLAASACTRFGVFHAGMRSAEDPKYTVLPQRERLDARRERSEDD